MFDRKKPCKTCPFRTDEGGLRFLGIDRAIGIVDSLARGATFTCHDDLPLDESSRNHCVGAMLMLEKVDAPNQMMRIGERMGWYRRQELIGHDEVFDEFDDWIDCQADENDE